MKLNSILFVALFFLVTIAFIGFVHADSTIQTLGTFQSGKSVNLIQNCVNSTYSNISRITSPNGTFLINSPTSMTKNNNDYNYTFTNTSSLGQYIVYGSCDENGIINNWVYDFTSTPTGSTRTDSLWVFGTLFITSLSLIAFALAVGNEYIGFIGGLIMVIAGVYSMIYGLGNLTNTWTQSVAYVIIGIGAILEVSAGYDIISGSGLFSNNKSEDDFD